MKDPHVKVRAAKYARAMKGLFSTLTDEQKAKALSMDESTDFGPDEFKITPTHKERGQ